METHGVITVLLYSNRLWICLAVAFQCVQCISTGKQMLCCNILLKQSGTPTCAINSSALRVGI